MLPERIHTYLLIDLESAPAVLSRLVAGVTDWDRRPDPDRFTLREMVAHLADWDGVFLGRLTQTRDQENATLHGLDEGQVALDNDYAHADPSECLARYAAKRKETVAFLRALSPGQWGRSATHTEVGAISMEAQAVLIAVHDGYHRQQALDHVARGE